MGVRRWLVGIVVPLAVVCGSCALEKDPPVEPGDDSSVASSPSDPSLVLGAPGTSPTPSPTPGAAPGPGATPDPAPTPAKGACSLPPSRPANPVCTSDPGHLLGAVEAAIRTVTQRRPSLFDFTDSRCADCYRVVDVGGYYAAVQAELASRGVCTSSDLEEIGAKDSNLSSEQFDILLASGHIRRGPGVYRGICSPAIF